MPQQMAFRMRCPDKGERGCGETPRGWGAAQKKGLGDKVNKPYFSSLSLGLQKDDRVTPEVTILVQLPQTEGFIANRGQGVW